MAEKQNFLTPQDLLFFMFIKKGTTPEDNQIEINRGRMAGHTTCIVSLFDPEKDLILCPRSMVKYYNLSYREFKNSVMAINDIGYRGRNKKYRYIFVDSYSYLKETDNHELFLKLSLLKCEFCFKLG